jgi:hypothetical protein
MRSAAFNKVICHMRSGGQAPSITGGIDFFASFPDIKQRLYDFRQCIPICL